MYDWDTPPSATGAPSRLRVATCQHPMTHDMAANADAVVALIRRAADQGADVAHFPECSLSGYGPFAWPDWNSFDWDELELSARRVRTAARQSNMWVVLGSVQRASRGAKPTNSLLVLDRRGDIAGRYDKQRCSLNDLRAFTPGRGPLVVDIEGARCGFLICLDWSFPEVWEAYAGDVELVFHSCVSDNARRVRNEAVTIPPLMQGYARLHQFAISVSNSCRVLQNFASFWVERSGHMGRHAPHSETGLAINELADDADQDHFFAKVREFRRSTTNRARDAGDQ